jgi:hypothetical protein
MLLASMLIIAVGKLSLLGSIVVAAIALTTLVLGSQKGDFTES